jgi:hypothetical protein
LLDIPQRQSLLFDDLSQLDIGEDQSQWHQLTAIAQARNCSPIALVANYKNDTQRYPGLLQRAYNEIIEQRCNFEKALQFQNSIAVWRDLEVLLSELSICVGQRIATRTLLGLRPHESTPSVTLSMAVSTPSNCLATQRYASQLGLDQIETFHARRPRRTTLERQPPFRPGPFARSRSSSIQQNSTRFKNLLNDAKESLFKLFFDMKEIDNWAVDEKELTELKDLVRNYLNRPKLLNEVGVPTSSNPQFLSKLVQKSDALDGVKRSWSILSFAEISFKFMQSYNACYHELFKNVVEFIQYLLSLSKTDALFELYFWTEAFFDGRPSKKLDFLPERLVNPFNWFFIGFKDFLHFLDPEIETRIKSCMVGLF